ncbi:MAG: helix-turn-helix domain-containing protein [Terracidiphilus sp.]
MEWNIQSDNRLDWPEIVRAAKRRRQEMKLTQRRLAGVAGVSLPTVVKFEAGQDVRLSSALAILKVLNLAAQRIEGTLLVRANGAGENPSYQAMFAPYAGQGGAMEPRSLGDEDSLGAFLDELQVGVEEKTEAMRSLARQNKAEVVRVQLSPLQLTEYWPVQFPSR